MFLISQDIDEIIKKTNLDLFNNKEVLITGSTGLLGTYFIHTLSNLKLLGKGPSKIFVSSKTDIESNWQKNIYESTEIIIGDLNNSNVISSLPKADIIIHLAGYAQPSKFLEDEFSTINLNTSVTLNLISKVRQKGSFLFMSTSEVYSGLTTSPYFENQVGTTNTNHPRAAYIESKRTGEAITHIANKKNRINAKSIRLALAYGPGTKLGDSRVLNSFIHQALLKKSIEMRDTGKSVRTYCYISDVIEMIFKVMSMGNESLYNVGGISKIKIRDLAKMISVSTNCELVIPLNDSLTSDGAPQDVLPSINKVINLTQKKDFVTLEEGLRRTIDWQKSNLFCV